MKNNLAQENQKKYRPKLYILKIFIVEIFYNKLILYQLNSRHIVHIKEYLIVFANSFTSFIDNSWVKAETSCIIYTNLYWFKIMKLSCSWRNANGRSLKIFSQNKTSTSAITLERTIYVDHWFNILRLFVYNTIINNIFYSTRGVTIGTCTPFTPTKHV